MAVNINGDTGIDKVQPGTIDSADFGPGVITAPAIASGAVTSAKLDTSLSIPGTMTATSFSGDGSSLTGIAGGFSNMDVFTSSGTWTNPGNVTKVKVTVVGGGGGGGGGSHTGLVGRGVSGGVGGGGGGSAIEVIPFPSATNVPVTIGSGGSAGTGGNTTGTDGGTGGTTSFGAYCSATGGGGGDGSGKSASFIPAFGGSGSGGTINFGGADGQVPNMYATDSYNGGNGGNSMFGGAGRGGLPVNPGPGSIPYYGGLPGNAYGAGGGGGRTASPYSTPGGAGSSGVVIVEY